MKNSDIIFPNLGIDFSSIDSVAFTIFGIEIYWYGIIICAGIISGLLIAMHVAKKTKQDPDVYSELLIYALVGAIIGARLYYVVFSWNEYKDNLISIFAFREGGLAIFGGVIGAVIAAGIFAKIKKFNFWLLVDTGAVGLVLGQAIGRWGNFMNMEAFGGYTNNILAMAIKVTEAKYIPQELVDKYVYIDGVEYIQVHPTFLYESLWCIAVLIILLVYTKYKKFDGEVFMLYLVGYSLGRVWIEGLRTDQLVIDNLGIAASQLLSVILIVAALTWIVVKRIQIKKG